MDRFRKTEEVAIAEIPDDTLFEAPPKLKTPLEHAIIHIHKTQEQQIEKAKASVEKALKQYLDSGKKTDQKKYKNALKSFENEKEAAEKKAKLDLLSLLYEFEGLNLDELNAAIEKAGFSYVLESPKPVVAVPLYQYFKRKSA